MERNKKINTFNNTIHTIPTAITDDPSEIANVFINYFAENVMDNQCSIWFSKKKIL